MNSEPLASVARWPNVPACYGWLTLDARGQWRLGEGGGELVRHAGLINYLNRNYRVSERGEWFVQNGPQRVFVTLTRAPFIVRVLEPGVIQTHTGLPVQHIAGALIDADGNAYLTCEHGLAGIDDRDLAGLLDSAAVDEETTGAMAFTLGNGQLLLDQVDAAGLPGRFGFVLQPGPSA
jgi:hypothetical protein